MSNDNETNLPGLVNSIREAESTPEPDLPDGEMVMWLH